MMHDSITVFRVRGARVLKAPADQPYGLRDFDVADLDGNMLFFGMETPKS